MTTNTQELAKKIEWMCPCIFKDAVIAAIKKLLDDSFARRVDPEGRQMIEIGLNQIVRVKLTPRGIFHYQDMMAALNRRLPSNVEPLKIDPPLDAKGYYRATFWSVMRVI